MSHIIREGGQKFVIPSYRDVLSTKKFNLLKKEILLLSKNYGEYVTLQKKNATQIEVAFSPEPGLLFGETAWNYFKRPKDLIYCEEIPGTHEALLVIVKAGSVYLDGSFPMDSIADELVIFQTEKNNFDIYVYGNVPLGRDQSEGKFFLDAASVKSFTVLETSAFAKFPTYPQCDLRLVDNALKSLGIGALPVKKLIKIAALVFILFLAANFLFVHKEELPGPFVQVVSPYQPYKSSLTSPSPFIELQSLSSQIARLYTIPGWVVTHVVYGAGVTNASVKSIGARTNTLFEWSVKNRANVNVATEGFYVVLSVTTLNRPAPQTIYKTESIIANLIDRLSYVLPGNNLTIGEVENQGKFTKTGLSIKFDSISPTTFSLIGQQLKGLPLNLVSVDMNINDQNLSGTIELIALGN